MGQCAGQQTTRKQLKSNTSLISSQIYNLDLNNLETHSSETYLIFAYDYEHFRNQFTDFITKFQYLNILKTSEQLRKYTNDDKNNILILFCRSDEEINKKIPNIETYSKILITYDYQLIGLDGKIVHLKKLIGFRFAGLIQSSISELQLQLEKIKKIRNIYFCLKDKALINRTIITFDFFFCRQIKHQKGLFIQWIKSKGKEGDDLVKLIEDNNNNKIVEILVSKLLNNDKILIQAINLLGKTKNPLLLPHISWFYSALFDHIRLNYKQSIKRLKKTNKNTLILKVQLTAQQIQTLSECQSQNSEQLMFSTFKIGNIASNSSNLGLNNNNNNNYFIYINIPQNQNYLTNIDLGFYFNEGKFIINIMNFFSIDNFKGKQINITYSKFEREYQKRIQSFRYQNIAIIGNIRLFKLYDFFIFNKIYVQSQLDLLFALQMYHKYREYVVNNLQQTRSRIQPNQNQSLAQSINSLRSTFRPSKNVRQSMGDSFALTGNYDQASQFYQCLQPKQRGLVKLLYMYQNNEDQVKFRDTSIRLKELFTAKLKYSNVFLSIAIRNYDALMEMRYSQYKKAGKRINQCLADIRKEFTLKYEKQLSFHPESLSSWPLYYILVKTDFLIAEKRGKVRQSQQLEAQFNQNWINFEGVHLFWLP